MDACFYDGPSYTLDCDFSRWSSCDKGVDVTVSHVDSNATHLYVAGECLDATGNSEPFCCELNEAQVQAQTIRIRGTDKDDRIALHQRDPTFQSAAPGGTTLEPLASVYTRVVDVFAGEGGDSVWSSNEPGMDIRLYGEKGVDYLYGGPGVDQLFGGDDQDHMWGGGAGDTLKGEAGNDLMRGQDGDDTLWGGEGNDKMWGGADEDTLRGGNGADRLFGGADNDYVHGEGGHDPVLRGDGGSDHVTGGIGDDVLYGSVPGASETDVNYLHGGMDDDVLHGSAGPDVLMGGAGADELWAGAGDDVLCETSFWTYTQRLQSQHTQAFFSYAGNNTLEYIDVIDGTVNTGLSEMNALLYTNKSSADPEAQFDDVLSTGAPRTEGTTHPSCDQMRSWYWIY